MTVEYITGADLPDLKITWTDNDNAVINFSTGWTFEALVGKRSHPALITKTTGITGASSAPNLTIAWDEGELDALTAGNSYDVVITATRTADDKQRKMTATIFIKDTVGVAAS